MSQQWCDEHWARIRDADPPVNGLIVSLELMRAWMARHEAAGTLPGPRETAKLNAMLEREGPLCCLLGDTWLDKAAAAAIVPVKYRALDPRVGHLLHMQEAGYA